jgi:hypothetical protein
MTTASQKTIQVLEQIVQKRFSAGWLVGIGPMPVVACP